jgi:DNA polymerase III subunit delta
MKNVFLIHGEDDFLSSEKLIFFRDGSIKKYGDFNVTQFSEENLDLNRILNEMNSLPFLGEKRVLILENILSAIKKDDRKKLIESALSSPESTVVIFFENKDLLPYKAKDRIKEIESFIGKLDPKNVFHYQNMDVARLNRWIGDKLKAKGFSIEPKAINGIVALVGYNTRQIDNEIKKLTSYKYKEKNINSEDVLKLVKANVDTNIFSLTDALAKKDTKTAQRILKNITDSGEEIYGVLSMIAFQFRNLILIKLAEKEKISLQAFLTETRMNPFVHKKTSAQVRNFTLEKLKEIFHLIFETDLAIKTGEKEPELALDLLIVRICS